jgi:hypothetical protein
MACSGVALFYFAWKVNCFYQLSDCELLREEDFVSRSQLLVWWAPEPVCTMWPASQHQGEECILAKKAFEIRLLSYLWIILWMWY